MPKAPWNGIVLAESDDTVVVEGNHYFPRDSVKDNYVSESSAHYVCPWKGLASYFDVVVDGRTNQGAAWYYASPTPAAADIKDRVVFWKGVRIES